MVEGKGLGHPDANCDFFEEKLSQHLCRFHHISSCMPAHCKHLLLRFTSGMDWAKKWMVLDHAILAILIATGISSMETVVWAHQTGEPRPGHNNNEQGAGRSLFSSVRITLFLCGDVMTGRGIDQVLAHPSDPVLYEPYIDSAYGYVELAQRLNGPIAKPVADSYIWGDSLAVLDEIKPDVRIINLETSVTTSEDYWPSKGINYRMHPQNIGCLKAARLDCCVLANNHALDWGHAGLVETLATLRQAGIVSAGAGMDRTHSEAPAILEIPGKGRVLVFAYGSETSGVFANWAATADKPGINVLPDLSGTTFLRLKKEVAAVTQPGDLVLVSLHWGGNWGYGVSATERAFAHRLIDEAGVDVIFGHSSHHAKGIEVYRSRLILYGCGDFINDYEGIGGCEQYGGDLTLMYFPSFEAATGRLVQLRMVPMRIRRFQTIHVRSADRSWLMEMLTREGKRFGTRVQQAEDGSILLQWQKEEQ